MKIASINKLEPELTVDIEVADTHTYQLGNGTVSHNTTSKLFGLTEGAHLPAMREYVRWVQFRNDDPLIAAMEKKGYPIKRDLQTYRDMVIVGFPTKPEICSLGMGDKLITAAEATPEEQYSWLKMLELYYIHGIDPNSNRRKSPSKTRGNQVSYTLKYNTDIVSKEALSTTILDNQPFIAACSIMPSEDGTQYEYLPEEAVTKIQFNEICSRIEEDEREEDTETLEDINQTHIDCAGGACPVNFNKTVGETE